MFIRFFGFLSLTYGLMIFMNPKWANWKSSNDFFLKTIYGEKVYYFLARFLGAPIMFAFGLFALSAPLDIPVEEELGQKLSAIHHMDSTMQWFYVEQGDETVFGFYYPQYLDGYRLSASNHPGEIILTGKAEGMSDLKLVLDVHYLDRAELNSYLSEEYGRMVKVINEQPMQEGSGLQLSTSDPDLTLLYHEKEGLTVSYRDVPEGLKIYDPYFIFQDE